jgi:hypothetical protein
MFTSACANVGAVSGGTESVVVDEVGDGGGFGAGGNTLGMRGAAFLGETVVFSVASASEDWLFKGVSDKNPEGESGVEVGKTDSAGENNWAAPGWCCGVLLEKNSRNANKRIAGMTPR